jgi:hypothetical protein
VLTYRALAALGSHGFLNGLIPNNENGWLHGVQDARKKEAMKASSFAVALGVLVAIPALVGCDSAGGQSQSQIGSSQARSQILPSSIRHETTGSGKKKVGKYWWVWNTVYVAPRTTEPVFAFCPGGYVPTGGTVNDGTGGSPLDNVSEFGWGANEDNTSYYNGETIEAWAICAKDKGA